ncbi:MAG: hypothetical protein LBS45_07165 [Synergistaceae bacterium]|jgi:hypothetical protein|nr:hypothetical protein [Synergistaceae bacterium]
MDWKKAGLYAGIFALGGAAFAVASSGLGRRACVSLVRKGIKLKECAAYTVGAAKEGIEDIVAEAHAEDEGCCCCVPEETCEI